jgi:hypothetical protein
MTCLCKPSNISKKGNFIHEQAPDLSKKGNLMAYVTIKTSFFGNPILDHSGKPGEPGNNV